jgi:hypothetical protein
MNNDHRVSNAGCAGALHIQAINALVVQCYNRLQQAQWMV